MFERIVCLKLARNDETLVARAIEVIRGAFPNAWIGRPFDEKSRSSWDLCIRLRSERREDAERVVGSDSWLKLTAELGTDLVVLKTWGFEQISP